MKPFKSSGLHTAPSLRLPTHRSLCYNGPRNVYLIEKARFCGCCQRITRGHWGEETLLLFEPLPKSDGSLFQENREIHPKTRYTSPPRAPPVCECGGGGSSRGFAVLVAMTNLGGILRIIPISLPQGTCACCDLGHQHTAGGRDPHRHRPSPAFRWQWGCARLCKQCDIVCFLQNGGIYTILNKKIKNSEQNRGSLLKNKYLVTFFMVLYKF